MRGFLGTQASFAVDLNLIAEIAMGAALIAGALMARAKRFKVHGVLMTAVMLLNLAPILAVMWPSFHKLVVPQLPRRLGRTYDLIATVHGALGLAAELFGLYLVLAAGTSVIPERWRIRRWKVWMRAEFAAWWAVLLLGIVTYCVWYGRPAIALVALAKTR